MQTVAGTFATRADAERAAAHLDTLGIPRDRITLLSPGTDTRRVPTDEGERPGTGAAIGGVVGAATGAAVGFPLGAAITMNQDRPQPAAQYALGELIFHSAARVHRWEEKAGFSFLYDYGAVATPRSLSRAATPSRSAPSGSFTTYTNQLRIWSPSSASGGSTSTSVSSSP